MCQASCKAGWAGFQLACNSPSAGNRAGANTQAVHELLLHQRGRARRRAQRSWRSPVLAETLVSCRRVEGCAARRGSVEDSHCQQNTEGNGRRALRNTTSPYASALRIASRPFLEVVKQFASTCCPGAPTVRLNVDTKCQVRASCGATDAAYRKQAHVRVLRPCLQFQQLSVILSTPRAALQCATDVKFQTRRFQGLRTYASLLQNIRPT
eukprot:361982-Chlamydomonas_euryale.AAC.4